MNTHLVLPHVAIVKKRVEGTRGKRPQRSLSRQKKNLRKKMKKMEGKKRRLLVSQDEKPAVDRETTCFFFVNARCNCNGGCVVLMDGDKRLEPCVG